MNVNGAFFQLKTLTFGSSATTARTLTGVSSGGISVDTGIYNDSSASHTLAVEIGVDGGTVAFQANSGNMTFSQNFYLNANTAAFSGGNNITVSGVMSGTGGGATKAGSGRLTLSANNTFTGTLTLNAGAVRADGTTTGSLGAGTLTLNGGTLEFFSTANRSYSRNTTVGGSATIVSDRTTSGAGFLYTLGTLSIGAHTLSVNAGGNVNDNNARVTFGATTFSGTPPVFNVGSGALLTLGALQSPGNFTKQGSGQLTLGTAANAARNSGAFTITAGKVRFGNIDNPIGTAACTITMSGGELELGRTGNTLNQYPVTISGNATIIPDRGGASTANHTTRLGTLSIGAHTLTLVKGALVTSPGISTLQLGAATFTGAPTFVVPTEVELLFSSTIANGGHLMTVQGAGDSTVSGIMSGGGGLTKSGNGTMTLSGANSYTGASTVNGGILRMNGANRLSSSTAMTVNSGGTFDLNGNNTQVATLAGAGAVTLGSGTLTTAGNGSTTFSGTMTGTGGLNKLGSGTLTISGGANTYNGATFVSNGTLIVSGSIGSSPTTVRSGATLMGGGTVGNLTIEGLVDPGNSTGARATLNAGTVALVAGGGMRVDISSVSGTAGTAWDLIAASGTITVNGSGTFTIYLHGTGTGFNSATPYSWKIMDGTVSGFDGDRFVVNTDNFAHALDGGAFSIDESSLHLVFTPFGASPPTVTTTIASATNQTWATAGGNVTDDGGASVTNRGVVWGTSAAPTVPGPQTTNGTGTGAFTSYLTNLTPGVTYYYRAFAQNSADTGYGDEYTLTTLCVTAPVIQAGSSISDTNFTANWNASDHADSYRLDVSTSATFSAAGPLTNVFRETMGTVGGTTAIATHETNDGFDNNDYTMSDGGAANPADIRATSVSSGYNDPAGNAASGAANVFFTGTAGDRGFSIEGIDTTEFTDLLLSFGYRKESGSANTTFDIEWSTNSGSSWNSITLSNMPAAGAGTGWYMVSNLTVSAGAAGSTNLSLRWVKSGTVAGRVDDVLLQGKIQSPSFIPGFSNRTVAGTSAVVTGLTVDVTYYYRVRAVSAGGCSSGNSATQSVTTITIAPDIVVRGNNQVIADGDTTPTVADHTDFGVVGLINSNLVRTYTITNDGNATLTLQNVAIGGTHPGDFTVIAQPTLSIAASGTTTFQVRFDPTAVGTRTATLFITNNVAGKNPYDFVIQGTGVAAGILRSPDTINLTTMVGSSPAASGFGVTNVGKGQLIYTITTNRSWLSVSPVGATLSESAGQQHTVTFNVNGLHAGVSNATITITDGNASNSPQTVEVNLTLTNIPDATAIGVLREGAEYVYLAWTKPSSHDVMIVHRADSASTAPSQGTSYSVGGSVGGGTVIYKGAGSSFEHIVRTNQIHHYAFYAINNNHYSPGVTTNASTPSYASGIVVETFSYTNTGHLGTSGHGAGGVGWGGSWYGDTSSFGINSGNFANQADYPDGAGNKVLMTPPSDQSRSVFRELGQIYNNGRLYFGYILNYQYDGANKYAGLSFYWDNTSEKLFFGEIYGQNKQLGIDSTGSSYTLDNGSGNDYIIVGYYDWAAGEAKAKAYKIGSESVPTTEPGSWDVTVSKSSNDVGWVNSIRLAAGAGGGSGTPGDVYFDEVRLATSWADLVQVVPANPDDPDAASATVDGPQMARLAWTKNGDGDNVLILHKTSAITVDPIDGNPYSVGNTIDGATVIYNGSATALEHVVAAGSSAYYKFYSVNGNYYSPGLVTNISMPSYGLGKIDQFAYTNTTSLAGGNTGQGFSGAWSIGSGTWTIERNISPNFTDVDGYPDFAANRVIMSNPGDGNSATAHRDFSAISTGVVYVAALVAYEYEGADKWAGISLMDGSTERMFLGKGYGGNFFTFAIGDGSSTFFSSADMRGQENSTSRVYLVVGKYDIAAGEIFGKIYSRTDTLPETEPGSWDTSQTGLTLGQVTRIRIGGGAGSGTIGRTWFDEIRVGQSWSELVAAVCPTWVGAEERDPTGNVYLGDDVRFKVESYPIGVGQSASLTLLWEDTTSSSYDLHWWKHESNNSFWTNLTRMSKAGDHTFLFTVEAGACDESTPATNEITVLALNNPVTGTATTDGVNSNSQINLAWTKNAQNHNVIVVRRTINTGWPTPTQGQEYFASDVFGDATVVYNGSGTSFNDTGLAPNTTYYYRFYSVNNHYYSSGIDDNDTTGSGTQTIVVDGNGADWVGTAPIPINSARMSSGEYIWRDKVGEVRNENANHENGDISEFRVFANTDYVYFLVKMTNITAQNLPLVAIGVDTRRSSDSTELTWLGDNSGTMIGSGYFTNGAAIHYPEYQINVHDVGGTVRVEAYAHNGASWFEPSGAQAAISTTHNAIEVRVARSALNLTGAKTARFTVASFINTGIWANEGDATVQIAAGTPDAIDSISIPPYQINDGSLTLSSWAEDISDGDIDFFFDVGFGTGGLVVNAAPTKPASMIPTNNATILANPTLSWHASTDSDGEVTGYFLEVSTSPALNGVDGTENGAIFLRVNLPHTQTNYNLTTTATQYYWRVRARDTAGELSSGDINSFRVVGKLDNDGPQPTLLYIGTDVSGFLNGDYDDHIAKYGYIQDVTDEEINVGTQFGYVIRLEDPSGVYATNRQHAGGTPNAFTYNIVSSDGRVSPNWDIIEYQYDEIGNLTNTYEWGIDRPFFTSNVWAQGNSDQVITTYVFQAFQITNFNPLTEYYLTVSAEDSYTEGGSWWEYGTWSSFGSPNAPYWGGYAADGPNTARNITTNYLIRIQVRDDDAEPPVPATGAAWASNRSLLITNQTGVLSASGAGLQALYTVYDGQLSGEHLSVLLNVYDYYSGLQLSAAGPANTNTTLNIQNWVTNNYANYNATLSMIADTTEPDTVATWHWSTLTRDDVTALWGGDGSGAVGQTNRVSANLFDRDADRDGDQSSASNVLFGFIQVQDDDIDPPVINEFTIGGEGGVGDTNLIVGGIAIIGVNGALTNGPERFSFVVLAPFPAGTIIDFTDCGWDPSKRSGTGDWHRLTEFHTNRWVASGNLDVGQIVELSLTNINNGGDQVVVYQYSGSGNATNDPDNVKFIYGINLGPQWYDPPIPDNNESSGLYRGLTNGATAVTVPIGAGVANARYVGPTVGTSSYLLQQISNSNNWEVLASGMIDITNFTFTVTGTGDMEWSMAVLTDADIRAGGYMITNIAQDVGSGLVATNASWAAEPHFVMYNTNQEVTVSNRLTTSFSTGDAGVHVMTLVAPPTDYELVTLGIYSSRTVIADADNDRASDSMSSELWMNVVVIDDDADPPVAAEDGFRVFIGNTLADTALDYTNMLAGWNFNQTNLTVSHGFGSLSHNFITNTYFSGSLLNAVNGDADGVALALEGGTSLVNNGRYFEFEVSMAGHESLVMSFAAQRTGTGFNNNQVSYSLNGISYTDFDPPFSPAASYGVHVFDFSAVTALDGANKVFIRITLNGASAANGNNRYDNVRFIAVPVTYEITDGQLAAVDGANPLWFSFGAHDAYSGLKRGTTYDGTNMHISVDDWLTNNAANYYADWSTADSTLTSATSAWRFTSFSYNEIGNLYGDGEQSRSVAATLADADNDRPGDTSWISNHIFGVIRVIDDDPDPPVAGPLVMMQGGAAVVEQAGPVELLAGWNFNASTTTVSHGAGTFQHNLINLPTFAFGGTTINAVSGDVAGQDMTITGGSGLGNNGRYFQFVLNMSGFQGLVMTYAAQRSGTGFTNNLVAYSTDGISFTDFVSYQPAASHALRSNNFTAVTALNNQPSVFIRITLGGATADGGNNRFDNFQFRAQRSVYQVTDGMLAQVDVTNPFLISFNVFDAYSGVARGTGFDGINMHVNIPGVTTNNSANFRAAMSSAGTTASSSTSLWEFTSFDYTQIGDLYGSGSNFVNVSATVADLDNDRPNDRSWISNNVFGILHVIDDDTEPPMIANVGYLGVPTTNDQRAFLVATNGRVMPAASDFIRGVTPRRTGTGTNTIWSLTDADLAGNGENVSFIFGSRDVHSGVSRGTSGGTNEVMSFSVGNVIVGNFADFNAGLSTTQTTTNQTLTNVWTFGSSFFDGSLINDLMTATNPVRVTIPDTDNDRPNDMLLLLSQQVGLLRVLDDDIRGPIISSVAVDDAYGTNVGLFTSFETPEGWPASGTLPSTATWTNTAANGDWVGHGVLWGTLNPKVTGTRRIGILTNTFNQPWLQLPPLKDPGSLVLFAGRFGAEGFDSTIRVERLDGTVWTNLGSYAVTNRDPEFEMLTWSIDTIGVVTLRVAHAGTGPQIYVDDITVLPRPVWISTNELHISWAEAFDDFSGVDEYRVVAPAIGAPAPTGVGSGETRAFGMTNDLFDITGHQGVITGFIFAVDDDNDRINDRAMGNVQSIIVRIDTNPPPRASGLRATDAANDFLFDPAIDETTEIKIEWTPPGATEAQAAGWRQSDNAPLSPWDSYLITYFEVADENGVPIAGSVTATISRANTSWSNVLNNFAFTNLVLSNLNFDAYYMISIQGRDEAGNVGLATNVVGNTDRFVVTQGISRVGLDLEVRWKGVDGRDYDVLYVDPANGFSTALSNQWSLMQYTNRPVMFDTGGVARVRPGELTNTTYRFYRVARTGRWSTNLASRSGSVEIYVTKSLNLYPGENWHSLFFVPDTATVAYVFQTNLLPAAVESHDATKITWFGSGSGGTTNQDGVATAVIWLASSPGTTNWTWLIGGSGVADEKMVPLDEAFLLELPMTAEPQSLVLIGQLPTNQLIQAIPGGSMAANTHRFLSHHLPVRTPLSSMGFMGSGFTRAGAAADEIRVLAKGGDGSLKSPKVRIRLNSTGTGWEYMGSYPGYPAASQYIIEPDDAIIIVRRNPGTMYWTNRVNFTPPTKNFTP